MSFILNKKNFFIFILLVPIVTYSGIYFGNGLFDNIPANFEMETANWVETIRLAADRLFWILATISVVWTGADLILKKGDLSDFFGAFLRLIVILGFFYYLITANGVTDLGNLMLYSMERLASQASGDVDYRSMTPSDMLEAMKVLYEEIDFAWSDVPGSIVKFTVYLLCYICVLIIIINVILVLITIYITLYAGIILLGFGATNWTRDIAIGYLKQLGNLFIQYFILLLFIVLAQDLSITAIERIDSIESVFPLLDLFAALLVLAFLSIRVPPTIGGIVGGAGTGGSTFGIGQALGAVAGAMTGVGVAAASLAASARAMNSASDNMKGVASAFKEASSDSSTPSSQSKNKDDGKAIMPSKSNDKSDEKSSSSGSAFSDSSSSSSGSSLGGGESYDNDISSEGGGSSKSNSTFSNLYNAIKEERAENKKMKKEKSDQRIKNTYGGRIAERIKKNKSKDSDQEE